MKLTKENQANIRRRFEARTGAELPRRTSRPLPARSLLLAAVLAALLTATAFAGTLFSGLEGDELRLGARYLGDGVVEVTIENLADKTLTLQPTLKLLRWRTGEELPPAGEIPMENLRFEPGQRGVMTVDLSEAYDIAALEEPLEDDDYYFVLTNNRFAFGQDWMCFVQFSEPEEDISAPPPAKASPQDPLPAQPSRPVVSPVDPEWLRLEGPDEPGDQRWTCQWGVFTAERNLIAEEDSHALVLYACLPSGRYPDSLETIPVRYVLTYERSALADPDSLVFLHGQEVPVSDLEDCKVYEDTEYVCYEVSRYIFTDLERYVRDWADANPNITYSEEALARVQEVCGSFPEKISVVRRETPLTAAGYIPRAQ